VKAYNAVDNGTIGPVGLIMEPSVS